MEGIAKNFLGKVTSKPRIRDKRLPPCSVCVCVCWGGVGRWMCEEQVGGRECCRQRERHE